MKDHLRRRGNTWELRVYVGIDPITKRQKYLTRTFRSGKREADEAPARFTTEVAGGGHAAQDTTVGDLIRQYSTSPRTISRRRRSEATNGSSRATSPRRWGEFHLRD